MGCRAGEQERRLREAARVAPNQAARDFIEITRRVFTDDWTGLGALLLRSFAHTEACGFDQWQHPAMAFGMARPARDFFLHATRCNALEEPHWVHAAMASLHAGDPAHALEIAERGLEIADVTGFGLEEVRMASLIALGRMDEARAHLFLPVRRALRHRGHAQPGRPTRGGRPGLAAGRSHALAAEGLVRRPS